NLVGVRAGTVVAGLIRHVAGRPTAFASIALLLVVTMLITVLVVPDRVRPAQEAFTSARQVVTDTFTAPLRHPNFMWLMGSRLLILMGVVGIQSFTLFFFTDTFFHSDSDAATSSTTAVVGLVVLLAILVTWPAARLSDRIGRRPLIVLGGV